MQCNTIRFLFSSAQLSSVQSVEEYSYFTLLTLQHTNLKCQNKSTPFLLIISFLFVGFDVLVWSDGGAVVVQWAAATELRVKTAIMSRENQ